MSDDEREPVCEDCGETVPFVDEHGRCRWCADAEKSPLTW
jgi:hypothetical protein